MRIVPAPPGDMIEGNATYHPPMHDEQLAGAAGAGQVTMRAWIDIMFIIGTLATAAVSLGSHRKAQALSPG